MLDLDKVERAIVETPIGPSDRIGTRPFRQARAAARAVIEGLMDLHSGRPWDAQHRSDLRAELRRLGLKGDEG